MTLRFLFSILCSLALCSGCHRFAEEPVVLWDPAAAFPKRAEAPVLDDAVFHMIKKQRPDADGCNWTLGVTCPWKPHDPTLKTRIYRRGVALSFGVSYYPVRVDDDSA